jgi:hypothetical protein
LKINAESYWDVLEITLAPEMHYFMLAECMVPATRLPHSIQLAFLCICHRTFYQDNPFLDVEHFWRSQSPDLMAPDTVKAHVFATCLSSLEELETQ